MSDGKRRLPIYSEPSGFDDKEFLALHFNPATFFPPDCFKDHSGNKTSLTYHFQGLKELNLGYWSLDSKERMGHFQTAFGYFHLAHNFDRSYFCVREALSHVAGLLGAESLEEGEKYANSLESAPSIEELAFTGREVSQYYTCHLLHPGFYSASDLSKLEESLKGNKK